MTRKIEMPEYAWRAELLAKVMLTRRHDLQVQAAPSRGSDRTWDLLVELLEGQAHTGQVFAVEVKATLKPEDFGRSESHGGVTLRPAWIDNLAPSVLRARDAPFPVCVVGVAMSNDRGFYGWIRRPVLDGTNDGLATECPRQLMPFTDTSVDGIVDAVRDWYHHRRPYAAVG